MSVYCGNPFAPGNDAKKLLGDPQLIFEVLSPSTASHDARTKLPEYRELAGVQEIVLVDLQAERVRLVRRTGADGWADDLLSAGADLLLSSLNLRLPHGEIFARN